MINELIQYYFELKQWDETKSMFSRWGRDAKAILAETDGDMQKACDRIREVAEWCDSHDREWTLNTVLKHWSNPKAKLEKRYYYHGEEVRKFDKVWKLKSEVIGKWVEFGGEWKDVDYK